MYGEQQLGGGNVLLVSWVLCVHLHIVRFLQQSNQAIIKASRSGSGAFKWRAKVNLHETCSEQLSASEE